MTLAVDWAVKPQHKQNKDIAGLNHTIYFIFSFLIIYVSYYLFIFIFIFFFFFFQI